MKKLISTILLICMLSTLFTTFVAADHEISINSGTYVSSGTRFNITVNGVGNEGDNVSVQVKNKNGAVRGLKQFKIKGTDTFSYTIVVDTAVDTPLTELDGALNYTISLRDAGNKSVYYDIPLYTEASKLNIIEKFNDADYISEMTDYIDIYKKVFGFDLTYYEGKEDDVALYMLTNETPFTLGNIVELFNDSVIRAYLFNADYTADRTEVIEYSDYDLMLGFGAGFDNAESLYEDYKDMNAVSKAKVNEIAFPPRNSGDNFIKIKENFFMAVVETVFNENKDDSEDIYEFLKDHNDWLELYKLEDLKTYDAYQIISEISKGDIPDNKADFVDIYDEIYAKVCKKENVQKPSTGGASGGGGGGSSGGGVSGIGGAAASEEIGYEKPEGPAEIKPIETLSFDDIDGYAWAKEAIEALAAKGIVNGKAEGVFAPADNITREEFAKILSLAYNLDVDSAECDFADVGKDRWSYKYVAAMYETGAITGYPDGTFKPGSLVTREEMAVMLCRVLLKLSKIEIDYPETSSYKDYNEVSGFAQNSVRTLSNHKILSGDENGFFNPKKGATRAEVCKMIYNAGL